MKIGDLYWRRYKIPFRRSFANRYEQITFREGALLFLETDGGLRGLGEVAPLAGFGGSLEAALGLLARVRPLVIGAEVIEQATWRLSSAVMGWESGADTERVVLSGLCLAFFDLIAQMKQQSLGAYLANGRRTATRIPVNATVGGTTLDALRLEAEQAAARGFRCVKMKVGGRPASDDIERVRVVRETLGDGVTLRVDANGAWSFVEAAAMLPRLIEWGVALVEQPLAPNHRAGMRMLREQFPAIEIAADESVVDINSADEVLRVDAADVLVIKPAVVGGPVDAATIARRAVEKGKGVIITSLLDSGVGIAGALHVAAILPEPVLPCGLATAELLEATLVKEPLNAVEGFVKVPKGVGLGVTLDEAQLAEFCVSQRRAGL